MVEMDSENAKIERILRHNVSEVIQAESLAKELKSGKKLRIKLGIDPTSSDLHLGHAVVLGKLREFQDLGHKAVLIIGDFTARIGDPSGRDKTRPPLTEGEVKANMKKYLGQAGKILDIKKAEVVYNSKWLNGMKPAELLDLFSRVSLQQVLRRDNFDKRIEAGEPIRIHELLYPILQGYDSVAVKADVELGGSDQLYNLLVGRIVLEMFSMKPQNVLTVPLLLGTDGERKMSKSLGNYIGLEDTADDMFGKIMSIPDALVANYGATLTEMSADEIMKKMKAEPKATKEWLAVEIVGRFHGEAAAKKAKTNFENMFSRGQAPSDAPLLGVSSRKISALDIVVTSGVAKSKSDARRLIEQGGFECNGETIMAPLTIVILKGGEVVRIGKKHFFRIEV
jgi:tyrosyl-tRNA synthetase